MNKIVICLNSGGAKLILDLTFVNIPCNLTEVTIEHIF
jgi:hypothetical protein